MDNKESKIIFDNVKLQEEVGDKMYKDNLVVISETGTGKVLFRGFNKVLISGSEFNALKDFSFTGLHQFDEETTFLDSIPSYDTALSNNGYPLDEPSNKKFISYEGLFSVFGGSASTIAGVDKIYEYLTRRVCLFCVGIDGCGIENSRVFRVDNTKWIAPWGYANYDPGTGVTDNTVTNCLIPFKVRSSSYDLTNDERNIYFGRATKGDQINYFFKTFDSTPELIRRYADNSTSLDKVADVWADRRRSDGEIIVKLQMSIDSSDCREYFENLTGINTARINTISLCTAVPYKDGATSTSKIYYQDIRPFTKFNFPNESLINASKGISITYYLYY